MLVYRVYSATSVLLLGSSLMHKVKKNLGKERILLPVYHPVIQCFIAYAVNKALLNGEGKLWYHGVNYITVIHAAYFTIHTM
jgi:hypothetical protein